METRAGRILVVGASGFIGGTLCGHLHRAGRAVVAGMRNPGKRGKLPSQVERRKIPDLADVAADWHHALHDIDAVIHLVTPPYVINDHRTAVCREVNVNGTRRLLQACRARQVHDFIYMSSIKAVGEGTTQSLVRPYDEATCCEPQDEYGRSKLAAEQVIQEFAPTIGLSWKILRPPMVYGPGCSGNLVKLIRLLERGVPLPLGQLHNARSMLFVDNLCDAAMALLDHRDLHGVFHVADRPPVSTTELLQCLAEALGRPARLFPVPTAWLRTAGRLTNRSAEVSRLIGSLVVNADKITSATGWQSRVSFRDGIQATVRSLDRRTRSTTSQSSRLSRPAA